ncbi:MAG: amidohydrolase [Rhodothermales bacterium]
MLRPVCFFLIVTLTACTMPDAPTTTLYHNATVWTGTGDAPSATAFIVEGNRFTDVGEAPDLLDRYPDAAQIDLGGAFVTPGFIDNHVHFFMGGFQLASFNLRDAATPETFAQRIADFAAPQPAGSWITNGSWDHKLWGGELPRREWIDAETPDHPVFVTRLDVHMALANKRALDAAGITRNTPDPPGGTIVRDPETGEPTGILKGNAMGLVYAVIPDPPEAVFDAALDHAIEHALSLGLTQVHDVGTYGGWTDLDAFERARTADRLHLRIYAFMPIAQTQRLVDHIAANGTGDDLLRWGGLKGFVDGSLGSTTAWFYEPYTDAPGETGLLVNDEAQLSQWITEAEAAGLHLAIHAIGDRANDWLLDQYASLEAVNGPRDRRHRIEHAQHLTREAMARFANLDVIPSAQPYHAIDDGRWAETRIGLARIQTTYPFRSLLDADAPLTFGSDWTVAPFSPMEGVYAAVTRQTLDGAHPGGWVPEQKISVAEALHAYTAHNAYAGFQEDRLGQIAPGYLADFAVLHANPFEVAPEALRTIQVERTVVNGITWFTR